MAQESLTLTTTLNQLAELDRYNRWIFERISNAGTARTRSPDRGQATSRNSSAPEGEVMATDIVPSYRNELERLFDCNPKVRVKNFNLTAEAPGEFVADPFDSVVCLNVLEHIEDDLFRSGANA